eukprot:g15401.t1
MGEAQGVASHVLVMMIIALLAFTLKFGESFTFIHPAGVAQTRHIRTSNPLLVGSRRSSAPLGAQRAAENGASPALTKHLAPPVLSVPVFSLATVNENGSTNMNIVTYASPVGIKPEPLWMISLYKSTLSYENFIREGWGVLQLLRRKHAPLVPILGQSGGRDTNKAMRSAGEAFPWEQQQPSSKVLTMPQSVALVPGCMSYMTLHMVSKQPAGDHDAVICRIGSIAGPVENELDSTGSSESETLENLETSHLRAAGII